MPVGPGSRARAGAAAKLGHTLLSTAWLGQRPTDLYSFATNRWKRKH